MGVDRHPFAPLVGLVVGLLAVALAAGAYYAVANGLDAAGDALWVAGAVALAAAVVAAVRRVHVLGMLLGLVAGGWAWGMFVFARSFS
jgi:hypothetical protein